MPNLSDFKCPREDTVIFVPNSFRNEWSEAVGQNLDNCAYAPDKPKNNTRVFKLLKLILKAPRCGGKLTAANNCKDIHQKITSWKKDNISDLWPNAIKRLKERTMKTVDLLATSTSAELKSNQVYVNSAERTMKTVDLLATSTSAELKSNQVYVNSAEKLKPCALKGCV